MQQNCVHPLPIHVGLYSLRHSIVHSGNGTSVRGTSPSPPSFSKYTAAGSVLRQGVAAVPSYTSCGATSTIKPPPISAAMLSFTLAWCFITARLPTYLLILESSYASSANSAPASPVAVSAASSCLAERARSSVCSSSCSSSCDGRRNAMSSPQGSEMA